MPSDFRARIQAELDTQKVEEQLKAIEKRKVKLDADSSALEKELDRFKNRKLKVTLDSAGAIRDSNNFGDSLKRAFNIGSSAAVAAQAFRIIRAAIKDAKEAIEDYNSAITDLRIVTNASYQTAVNQLKTYNQIAQVMGATTKEVADSAVTWRRQGKTADEAITLTKDSMMLAKIGMIDSEKAAKNLTTTTKGYKIAVENTCSVVDKLGKLDSAAAVTAGELSEGMSKTAQMANDMGTFIKTMLSRMSDIKTGKLELVDEDGTTETLSDVETTLHNVGIDLRKTITEFGNFEDVLDNLSGKWNTLNSVQQAALAKAFSGVRQQNNFRVLMANYDNVKKYADLSANSAGAAQEKFNAYLDSIEAKTKTLQASFESLANNTVSSDLVNNILIATTAVIEFIDKSNILKGTLTGLIAVGAIKGFVKLATSIRSAAVTFNDFNAALKLSKTANLTEQQIEQLSLMTTNLSRNQLRAVLSSKALTNEQRIAILTNNGLTEAEAKTALASMGLATAEGTATTATFSLKGAIKGLWATLIANPLIVVATAIAGAVSIISTVKQKAEEAAKEATQNAVDGANDLKSSLSDIDGYISKIDELKEALSKDDISQSEATEKRKELLKIQEELIKKYGQEKDAVDYITESIQGETTALNNLQIASAKDYLRNNRDKIKDAYDYFNNSESRTVAMNDYHDLASIEAGYGDFMKILTGFLSPNQYNKGNGETYFNGTKDEIIAQYDDLRDKIQKYIDERIRPITPRHAELKKPW